MSLNSARHPFVPRIAAVAIASASLLGCGSATLQQLANEPPSPYGARCASDGAEHDKAVRELTYLRPMFKSLPMDDSRWPKA